VSAVSASAAAVQILGGILLAPLLPGLVQQWKARLQGRRGPSALQPYRELRRLWAKSAIDVEGATLVYRLAPSLAAGAIVVAVALVPVASSAPDLGVGHSMLALGGLLALARFAVGAAAWDTENGFALMGASRDLTLAVFVEAALVLSLAVAGGRDLAFLHWSAAARHWIVLVLAAQVFAPHAETPWLQLALLPVVLVVLVAALALAETLVAKMRMLLAPRLLAVGAAAGLLGVLTRLVELT
jgi:formate hydrogenlyase subunit 4